MHSLAIEFYPLLFATLLLAAIFDYRRRLIPNWISLSGWLIAPLLYLYFNGASGFLSSLYGLGLILALTFPLYLFGWMGAGDVKLMAAVGAYVGSGMALQVLLGILITGGLFALVMLACKQSLSSSISRIKASFGLSVVANKPVYLGPGEEEQKIVLPYAIPILAGTLVTLFVMNNL